MMGRIFGWGGMAGSSGGDVEVPGIWFEFSIIYFVVQLGCLFYWL